MTRLRKRWPRQRRAFRFIVPAGRRGRGPSCADPAGRPRRGNQHSPPGGRGPRRPRAVCPCASQRTRRRSLAGSAGSTPREEGARSEAVRATPGCARAAGANVRGAGSAGTLPPPAPAPHSLLLLSLPRPPPGSTRPAPPRRGTGPPAPGARSRRAPRAPAAPSPGSATRSQVGGGGSPLDSQRSPPRKLRGEWARRDCAPGAGRGLGGKSGLSPRLSALACPPFSSAG